MLETRLKISAFKIDKRRPNMSHRRWHNIHPTENVEETSRLTWGAESPTPNLVEPKGMRPFLLLTVNTIKLVFLKFTETAMQ